MKLKSDALRPRLAREDPPAALLLYGAEQGLINADADWIAAQHFQAEPSDADFDAEIFHGPDLEAERFLTACRALPFSAPRRLVMLREAERMHPSLGKVLAEYLERPSNTSLLLATAGPLEARNALRKRFESTKHAWCVPYYPLEGGRLSGWLRQRLVDAGFTVDSDALILLSQRLEGDSATAEQELEKLMLFMGDQRRIDAGAALAIVGETAAHSVFSLAETITAGKSREALHILERLLERGEEPLALLGMLAQRLRRIALAQEALAEGTPPDKALSQLRPPVFFKDQKPFLAQCRAIPRPRLADALIACQEADAGLKGMGRLDPRQVMERLVMELTDWFGRRSQSPARR